MKTALIWVFFASFVSTAIAQTERLEQIKSSDLAVAQKAYFRILREGAITPDEATALVAVIVENPRSGLSARARKLLELYEGPIPDTLARGVDRELTLLENDPKLIEVGGQDYSGISALLPLKEKASQFQERIFRLLLQTNPMHGSALKSTLMSIFSGADRIAAATMIAKQIDSKDAKQVDLALKLFSNFKGGAGILVPALARAAKRSNISPDISPDISHEYVGHFLHSVGNKSPDAAQVMTTLLTDAKQTGNSDLAQTALLYFIEQGPLLRAAANKSLMMSFLDDKNRSVRSLSRLNFSAMEPHTAAELNLMVAGLKTFKNLERDERDEQEATLASALSRSTVDLSDQPAVKAIVDRLRSADLTTRLDTLRSIATFAVHIPVLKTMLEKILPASTGNERVWIELALTVDRNVPLSRSSSVQGALSGNDANLQRLALHVLSIHDFEGKEALPALSAFVKSPHIEGELKEVAGAVLKRIQLADQGLKLDDLRPGRAPRSICEALTLLFKNREWQSEPFAIWTNPGASEDSSLGSLKLAVHSLNEILLSKFNGPEVGATNPAECVMPPSGALAFKDNADIAWIIDRVLETTSETPLVHPEASDPYSLTYRYERNAQLKMTGSSQAKSIEDNLKKQLGLFGSLGSYTEFNAFSYGVQTLALGKQLPQEEAQRFSEWLAKQPKFRLSYDVGGPIVWASPLGSATRNVPVYLAKHSIDRTSASASDVVAVLDNWLTYSGVLRNQSRTYEGHSRRLDGVASYFFYPGLPYVAAAVKVLNQSRTLLSEAEQRKLDTIRSVLRVQLPQLIDDYGRLDPSQLLPEQPKYAYPLYGLALVSLLEKEDTSCYRPSLEKDFGIIRWEK